MANILIRLNTVVYKFGKAIAKREEIMSAYLSEGLMIDAIFCGQLFVFIFHKSE
jgi:mannitol/fructose-specific phosphotransferase system IIA component (Ntr-type)